MKKVITIFLVLNSLFSFAQCQLNLLADDLSKSNKEFKEIVNETSGFSAWQILELEATALRTNIDELTLVSKNLDGIKNAGGYVKWKALQGAGNWVTAFPKLASKTSAWSHLELVFEGVDDYVRVLSKNGDEVAKVFKSGTDEVFEISDDFFRATPTNPATPITGVTVKANTGETIIGGGFFKNADGSIGFVEDVSSYGSTIVQNTIKNRGGLRGTINGTTATQDAHHIIPVQLLKENDVVKKAVEGGFSFNTSANGLGIEKYVKATGAGRHGPHPSYTNQIRNYLTRWANDNPGFTPQMARDELADVVNAVKNKINTTSGKINEINLGL